MKTFKKSRPSKKRSTRAYHRRVAKGRLGSNVIHKYVRTLSLYEANVGANGWQPTSNAVIAGSVSNLFLTAPAGASTGPNINYGGWSYNFQLGDLPSVSDFTNLYDQYRVEKFTLTFTPYITANVGVDNLTVASNCACILHYVKDYDDYAPPAESQTGIDALAQYVSYRRIHLGNSMGKPISITVNRPGIDTVGALVNAGTGTGTISSRKKQWLDCGSSTVTHFGIKGIFEILDQNPATARPQIIIKAECKVHLTLKETR